jgi:hypothetical protein
MVSGQIAPMQCALLHCCASHTSCHAEETLTLLPPSVLASLRFLGGAFRLFRAAPTADEQFDLVRDRELKPMCPALRSMLFES